MATKPYQFQKGWKGGPGRAPGSRNKLQGDFLRDLAEAWELEGKGALRIMCKEEPTKFVQVVASLMPREVALDVSGPLAGLPDEELDALIEKIRARAIEQRQSVPAIETAKTIDVKTERVADGRNSER
jgi:hypothetical protein